ncbi:Predicted DNA-binding transcriptional regulator YafY, contains an HTH and WYL domains [Singulisphaera sp. GP187]|uniref:helix-turn-helix transcriptional regulator n=1 Tax=Singulisphaera sp. GP187 TaxID=1882752 RepID=UPI0009270D5A|nr:transcriptional regulator [Singulisphaera sp. GP187]SIO63222.1 Predicted DNA-binding transcriptional regulator YafY, contains an HTH and WYL domains [Singulisphaera sp. GP187]
MPKDDRPRRSDSDRRLRQAARFARVLRVLELIQGRGRSTIKEIALELECSERTIFRDLAVLEMAGVPYYHDREDQCLRVRPGFHFPSVNLSDDELVGQATAATLTSAPGLDVTSGAGPTTRKLQVSSREKAATLLAEVERVTSVFDLKLADHSRHHETIKTIQWALIKRQRLTGSYATPYEPKPKRLELHPYRLCLVKQSWYLIARPEGSDQPQTYRVPRFKTLRPLDAPSVVPDNFNLKVYFGDAWGVYRGDQSYVVEVRFSKEAADLVTETTWHHTQKIDRHKDGSVTLGFQVDGLNEVVHWVLGWSGRARVVRPPELRGMLLEHLRTALDLNGNDPVIGDN